MRQSMARVPAGSHAPGGADDWEGTEHTVHGTAVRHMALTLAVVLLLGCVGLIFSPAPRAGATTPVLASGQVAAGLRPAVTVCTVADDACRPMVR
jgi:hypothetical protein